MSALKTTRDRFLDGRLVLTQPARGYRAGMDAALLAAACGPAGERVIEAGCGCGTVMLAVATLWPQSRLVGIERDRDMLALAHANIAANGLADRVTALADDIGRPFSALGAPAFDAALANPPFFEDPRRLRGPAPAKRAAFVADHNLAVWVAFLIAAVREGGAITLIHRPESLADLLAALSAGAGAIQVRPIHPFADAPAKRIIVRAVKSARTPLRLLAPLALHQRDGDKHTPEAEAILRGRASLDWAPR